MMATTDKDTLRMDRGALERVLRSAGVEKFVGKACRCPFHDDKHASAGVYEKDGIWRFKCQACGVCYDIFDVQAIVAGKKPEDILRELNNNAKPEPAKPARVFATIDELKATIYGAECAYAYTNPDTLAADLVIVRAVNEEGAKTFVQAKPCPGGFTFGAPEKPWPIYNRIRLRKAKEVIVVEGEKCVHSLHTIGIVATTSPGGAGKAAYADWSWCSGLIVYLWPDNDAPDKNGVRKGIQHMKDVAEILSHLEPPARVYWINPDDLGIPTKGDVVEYLDLYGGGCVDDKKKAIAQVLATAEPLGASGEVKCLIEDTISGKRSVIPWPWKALGQQTQALLPGTVTAVCGDPGSTKSFLMLEAVWWWIDLGVKACIFELEDDKKYHLNRALAQMDGNSLLTDSDWIKSHPDDARSAFESHQEKLDRFGRCIHAAPDEDVTLVDVQNWIAKQAAAGQQIIVVDPVTAAQATEKPWIADHAFVMRVKGIARQTGARIILVTHPRIGQAGKSKGLDGIAGGAAYPRLSHTVLWVTRLDKPRYCRMAGPHGNFNGQANRVVQIRKARNGKGGGGEIGFWFDPATLRSGEQGIILGDTPEGDEQQEQSNDQPY